MDSGIVSYDHWQASLSIYNLLITYGKITVILNFTQLTWKPHIKVPNITKLTEITFFFF